MPEHLLMQLREALQSEGNPEVRIRMIEGIQKILHEFSPLRGQPVSNVLWISLEKIEANDYNPNSVAKSEMRLLLRSIEHDNYTQPVVTIYDKERDKYIIVDGFHRYFVMKTVPEIARRSFGLLPVTVIDKDINARMASTIRHNRARGRHSTTGMSSMVFKMLNNGMKDEEICKELGMEAEELIRLKHITGFSKLFKDREYNHSWVTTNQVKAAMPYPEAAKAQGRE